MKIRKFEAKSLKDALCLVKKEMGSEAIVLSIKEYKKTFGLAGERSVEVTAVDHKKALKTSPQALSYNYLMEQEKQKEEKQGFLKLQKELSILKSHLKNYHIQKNDSNYDPSRLVEKIFKQMICSGIRPEYSFEIVKSVEATTPRHLLRNISLVKAQVCKYIMSQIEIANSDKNLFQCFVGGEKSGKTTCLIKYAYALKKQRKKIGILSLCEENTEQLKRHAQALEVPFGVIRKPSDWYKAYEKLKHFDCILTDCPSYDLEDELAYCSLKRLLPPENIRYTVHFVQSLKEKEEQGFKTAGRYKALFCFDDVIFSYLDQVHNYGMMFNFQRYFQSPLHSFSSGPEIPHSFEKAQKERLVSLIFEFADFKNNFLSKSPKVSHNEML